MTEKKDLGRVWVLLGVNPALNEGHIELITDLGITYTATFDADMTEALVHRMKRIQQEISDYSKNTSIDQGTASKHRQSWVETVRHYLKV